MLASLLIFVPRDSTKLRHKIVYGGGSGMEEGEPNPTITGHIALGSSLTGTPKDGETQRHGK